MQYIISFFQGHPLIPLFLTVGLGFWLGSLRYKSFSLGAVAATLIVGVLFGQMEIVIPDMVKNVFFLFFLFATGYSVGPQFFHALKGSGRKQALFALVEALVCAGLVMGAALLMGYDNGIATGLFAGSQTASACLGMISDTVKELPLSAEKMQYLLAIIPACYAVTYVFGTVGTAWFLSSVAPGMLGGLNAVKADVAQAEQQDEGDATPAPGEIKARRPVVFRAYKAEGEFFSTPRSVKDIEHYINTPESRLLVERVRINGDIHEPTPALLIPQGAHIVVAGRAESMVSYNGKIGPEVLDPDLLNFSAQKTPVTISGKGAGQTFGQLRKQSYMERVMVATLKRGGHRLPLLNTTELYPGDVITLVGWPRDVTEAASKLGYADSQSDTTDMVFVGLGIALGCLLGAAAITVKGVPMALGASVGALIVGLVFGWWRTRRPTFGHIPSAAIWIMENLGINMFIAVIGITAGASFIYGLKTAGWLICLIGAACTIIGLVINIFLARRVFRLSRPDTLGCVAGGRLSVAAIGAIRDTLQSDVPNLSFTITYAVANITLVFSSLLVLLLI